MKTEYIRSGTASNYSTLCNPQRTVWHSSYHTKETASKSVRPTQFGTSDSGLTSEDYKRKMALRAVCTCSKNSSRDFNHSASCLLDRLLLLPLLLLLLVVPPFAKTVPVRASIETLLSNDICKGRRGSNLKRALAATLPLEKRTADQ